MTNSLQALIHIANFVLKEEDAPASAQSHLDYAIAVLSEMCEEWNPIDADVKQVVLDAREHIGLYHEWAKKPWPKN